MRIRKNAKLSPLLFFSSSSSQGGSFPVEAFQTHVCQLNQSPWDVIPFDSDSIQFEYDSFTAANGSAGDSIGAVESVASMMDIDAEDEAKVEDMVAMMMVVDDVNHSRDNGKGAKDNEKGAKEVVAKNTYCNGSSSGGYNKKPAATAAAASGARSRAKPRAAGKKASSSSSTNPYEFYYYSGFGPLWSKRRGDRNGGEGSRNGGESSIVAESENVAMTTTTTTIAPSTADDVVANDNDTIHGGVLAGSCPEIDNVELDYVDIDDEEEEDGNDDESGKKRTRKPVKARSLKSLM